MKARQLVWSNREVQDLTKRFVSIADELHNLRKGNSSDAKFFQTVFSQKKKHPGHQGVFLATPSGRLLASSTCYEAKKVVALLRDGLSAWEKLAIDDRFEPKSELVDMTKFNRPEDHYPEDGLVLRVTSRDLPESSLDGERITRWHRYYIWFSQDEVQSMLPQRLERGSQHAVPTRVADRIAALALLDKGLVDGFTKPFRDSEVEDAALSFSVREVTDKEIGFQITGTTATKTRDAQAFVSNMPRYDDIPKYRGLKTEILGDAVFDLGSKRFTKFDMIASATRFGGAYVGRTPDDWSEKPIGFSFALGKPIPAERIAPEFPDRYPWLAQSQKDVSFADSGVGLNGKDDRGPSVGDKAPDFEACLLDDIVDEIGSANDTNIRVSFTSLAVGRPVILAFGSYT